MTIRRTNERHGKTIREKGGKEIKTQKGQRKGRKIMRDKIERNHPPLNFNGLFTLVDNNDYVVVTELEDEPVNDKWLSDR
jgi:hypothetical protein